MFLIVLIIQVLLRPSSGVVDCFTACSRCQEYDVAQPGILEVYCSMCKECMERRRERKLRIDPEVEVHYADEFPEGCPTPPPCESEPEAEPPQKLQLPTTTTTTTSTTTTTTTTRRPTTCPPIKPCRPRYKPPRLPCFYPCMPMCPCPYPYPPPWHTSPSPKTTQKKLKEKIGITSTEPVFVYVGIPKELLAKIKAQFN